MSLKATITRKFKIRQLKTLGGGVIIHSKELQEDGTYLITYTRYVMGNYNFIVNKLVKQKYSDSEEFAILRKAIKNPNNDEYLIYNAYVEDCKIKARAFIEERDSKLARELEV